MKELLNMKRVPYTLVILMFLFSGVNGNLFGQEFYRVNADFTVKIKRSDGTMNLTRGSVYYDKNIQELIYRVTFPQPEVWVISDTSLFKFREDTLFERISIPSVNEFTIFHLSLNSGISDFGLKKSVFKVSKVEKKKDMVLSYWKIPDKLETSINHVVVAKKENRLESVIMVGDESQILSKQFYRDYHKMGAFEFPQKIVQIIPDETGKENYQVTEFRNIQVNDMDHDDLFHYSLVPAL